MQVIERFRIQSDDGRIWNIVRYQKAVPFRPLDGAVEHVKAGTKLVCLEGPDRYHVNQPNGPEGPYEVVDFGSSAPNRRAIRLPD